MSTLLTAMRQREGMDEGMTCFNRDAKRSDLDELARAAQDHGGEANEMIGEVERLRPGLEKALEIVKGTYSHVESPDEACCRIEISNRIRAALDGASPS